MRIQLAFLFILILPHTFAQTIEGLVLDKETMKPVINANIYFNGTYKGTMTDTLGYFSLDASQHPNQTLVISSVGYFSESLFEYSFDATNTILLEPKTLEIEEIEVVFNKTEAEKLRKLGIKRFTKEFLGNTYNARKCEIQNIEDVYFKFSEDRKTFEAFANEPIDIYNGSLGYYITYHLDYFLKNQEEVFYKGTHFFVEDTSKRKRQTKKMIQHRKYTYEGSRMHFFRSLYNESSVDEGFVIRDSINNIVLPDSIVTDIENQLRYLTFKGKMCYYHFPNINIKTDFIVSFMEVESDSVLFTERGYFDPNNVIWSGKAAKRRVGDLLPFEYDPEEK